MTKNCTHCGKPFTAADIPDKYNFKRQKLCGMACANARKKFTPEKALAAFWAKVNKTEGCWLWTGALQRDGYAHFTGAGRKTISSHRHAYELLVGLVPAGMDLLHTCDVRHCVNPAHLRPGTHEDNMLDKALRGRQRAKITLEQAKEVKRLLAITPRDYGWSIEIAEKTGLSPVEVSRINRGKSWRHL